MLIKHFTIGAQGTLDLNDPTDADNEFYCIEPSPDYSRIVLAGDENKAFLVKSEDFTQEFTEITDYTGKIFEARFHPAGAKVCLVGADKDPVVYDLEACKKLSLENPVTGSLSTCAWSPDGTTLAVVSMNGTLVIFEEDGESYKVTRQWQLTEKPLKKDLLHGLSCVFESNTKILCSGKTFLQVVEKSGEDWRYSLSPKIKHEAFIYTLSLLEDNFLLTIGEDSKLKIWNLTLEVCLVERELSQEAYIQRVRYDPSTQTIFLMDNLGFIHLIENVAKTAVPETQPDIVEEALEGMKEETNTVSVTFGKEEAKEDKDPIGNEILEGAVLPDESNSMRVENGVEAEREVRNRKKLVYDEDEDEEDNKSEDYERDDPLEKERRIKQKKFVETYLTTRPQKPFQPGSTVRQGRRNYLCWNIYGQVTIRSDGGEASLIDVEYSLVDLPKKMIPNSYNYSMASVNYKGVLLASTGYIQQEDAYEDEEIEEDMKHSVLYFVPSTSSSKEWCVKLKRNENTLCIALGLNWCAVATNNKMIRLFGPTGADFFVFGFSQPIISMATYENLLAILYTDSFPFSGDQSLKVRVMNISNMNTESDCRVPLSSKSYVRWFGFSQEGSLFIHDSKHMLWTQIKKDLWGPIYDGTASRNLWMIGVAERKIIGLRLPAGEVEPNPLNNLNPAAIDFKIPFVNDTCKEIFAKTIELEQEEARSGLWGYMKTSAFSTTLFDTDDPMSVYRESIKTPEELAGFSFEIDKMRIKLIRQAVVDGKHEEAIWYGLQLENPKTLEACLTLLEKMGKHNLASKMRVEVERLGRLQFKHQSGGKTCYIPQIVYKTDTSQPQSLANSSMEAAAETALRASQTLKPLKNSFTDVLNQESETKEEDKENKMISRKKSSIDESNGKTSADEKHVYGLDIFRDLSHIKKAKK